MKYLLGVGFVVTEKYKKDPIVRVNIDDTFIDEFTLSKWPNYDEKWFLRLKDSGLGKLFFSSGWSWFRDLFSRGLLEFGPDATLF